MTEDMYQVYKGAQKYLLTVNRTGVDERSVALAYQLFGYVLTPIGGNVTTLMNQVSKIISKCLDARLTWEELYGKDINV